MLVIRLLAPAGGQRGAHRVRHLAPARAAAGDRPGPAAVPPQGTKGGGRTDQRTAVAEPPAASGVAPSDLGAYQHAVRLVLTNDLITEDRPRAGRARRGAALGRPDRPGLRRAARLHADRDRASGPAGPQARLAWIRPSGRSSQPGAAGPSTGAGWPTCAWCSPSSSGPGSRSAWPTWSARSPRPRTRSTASASTPRSPSTSARSWTSLDWLCRSRRAAAVRRLSRELGARHRARRRAVRHRSRYLLALFRPSPADPAAHRRGSVCWSPPSTSLRTVRPAGRGRAPGPPPADRASGGLLRRRSMPTPRPRFATPPWPTTSPS